MSTATLLCRVRPGAELAHNGQVLVAGEEVTLPIAIAHEVRHLVDEVIGQSVRPVGAASTFDAELAAAKPHERVSILEAQEASLTALLAGVTKRLAAERRIAAAANQAPIEKHADKSPNEKFDKSDKPSTDKADAKDGKK